MKKIIEIQDICEVSSKGVLIGGVNKEFSFLTKEDFSLNIGKTIEVINPNNVKFTSIVLDTDVSTSLIGEKNFFMLLPIEVKKLIQVGATAFEKQ
jgi:hypothetical protein